MSMDLKTARTKLQEIQSSPFRYGSPNVKKVDLIRGLAIAHSRIQELTDIIILLLPDLEERTRK